MLPEWRALEGTGPEVTAIRESFRKRFGKAPVRELRQKEPTENAIRQAAPKYRYLHFATHGFFAPPQLRSALASVTRADALPALSCSAKAWRASTQACFRGWCWRGPTGREARPMTTAS